MTLPILGFAGRMASGKTTISQHVAQVLGWRWAGFGAYVRAEARRRGWAETREVLQHISDELLADGLTPFCRAVLADAGWSPGQGLILDGFRHVDAVQAIRDTIAPQQLILVFVATPEQVRLERLTARGVTLENQEQHQQHSSETDVITALPTLADMIIDGARPLAQIVDHIHVRLSLIRPS